MDLSTDLLEAAKNPVFHIDHENLEIIEEVLIPVCQNDWSWYSYIKDAYLLESDVYTDIKEAAEALLGEVIAAKKQAILTLNEKERQLVSIIEPEYVNEGLVG